MPRERREAVYVSSRYTSSYCVASNLVVVSRHTLFICILRYSHLVLLRHSFLFFSAFRINLGDLPSRARSDSFSWELLSFRSAPSHRCFTLFAPV
jgi:hypothetical protein